MTKRALITGINGFAGSHLSELLLEMGNIEVHGTVRWRSNLANLEGFQDKLALHHADLKDAWSLLETMKKAKPDLVFHLAAQSFVPTSWTAPSDTMATNAVGTVNLLEAIRKAGITPRIHLAGSSEEYGLVYSNELPITEDQPLRPLSPYGVSKVATDLLGYQYYKSYKMHIVRTRAFNHTGPRRGKEFVCSNFARQIVEVENEQRLTVRVGNLDAYRDFTDVRDVVYGYWLAITKGQPGQVYNICTGTSHQIGKVLRMLCSMSDVMENVGIEQDPARSRPSDVPILEGSCDKFRKLTGWGPKWTFKKTLWGLLNYWRNRLDKDK